MLLWLALILSPYIFANIPLDKTIDIIVNKCFSNTFRFHGFTQQQFTDLLTTTVKNCHFLFDGKFIIKRMVLPWYLLGPLLANIFLSFHERTWLADSSRPLNLCSIGVTLMTVFSSFNLKNKSFPSLTISTQNILTIHA